MTSLVRLWVIAFAAVAPLGAACSSCITITPQPYPCAWDAGDSTPQCPSGWRCGLENRCHQVGAPAPYVCQSNADCEADWRCSVTGACVDPGTELLSPTQYEGPLTQTVYNPRIFSAPPLVFTHTLVGTSSGTAQVYASMIDGGILSIVQYTPGDGGSVRSESQFPIGPATKLAASSRHVFALTAGGVLYLAYDGGQEFLPEPDVIGLRRVESGAFAGLVQDAGFLWSGESASSAQILQLPSQVTPTDLQMLFAPGAPACLLAASPSGLFFTNYVNGRFLISPDGGMDGGLLLASTPAFQDAGIVTPGPIQRLFPSFVGLGFGWTDDAGTIQVGMYDYDGVSSDAGIWLDCDPSNPCCGRLHAVVAGPCPVCEPGDRLGEARPIFSDGFPTVEVRCIGPAGDSRWYTVRAAGGVPTNCIGPTRLFANASLYLDQVAYNEAFPQDVTYVGAHGGVWTGATGRLDQSPKILADAPSFFLELDAGVRSVSFAQGYGASGSFRVWNEGYFTAGEGFLLGSDQVNEPKYGGSVGGEPTWLILDNLVVTDLEGHSVAVPPQAVPSSGPFFGYVLRMPDGGTQMIAVTNDSIWTADLTDRLQNPLTAPPATFKLGLVPMAGASIASLSLQPGRDGGAMLSGYAVIQNQLFSIVARDPLNWRATPVALPSGTPVSVQAVGASARVGMIDGTIASLPGLVPLSPPLPESPPHAYGYSVLCGESYARGAQDVYRLQHSDAGDGTGQWVALGLADPVLTANGDPGLSGGRFSNIGDHLYVSTVYGGVWRLDAPSGCGP